MKTFYKYVLSAVLALLVSISSFAVTYTAVATGNWSSSTTWSSGINPNNIILTQDTIVIPSGITVYLNNNVTVIGTSSLLWINGTLFGPDNSIDLSRGSIYGNGNINLSILEMGMISTYDFRGTIIAAKFINLNSNLFLSSSIHVMDTLLLQSGSLAMGKGTQLILDPNALIMIDEGYLITDSGTFLPIGNYDILIKGESIVVESYVLHPKLRNLTINMTSNQQQVYLSSAAMLSGKLVLLRGVLIIEEENFTLLDGAIIEGGSRESYIITLGKGSLVQEIKAGGIEVLFPVGTNKGYSPAVLRQTGNGASGKFMVRAMDGVFTQGISGVNLTASKNVVDRSWVIAQQDSFNVNLEMDLFWSGETDVNAFDRNDCFISRYINDGWDVSNTSAAIADTGYMFSINRQNVSGGGVFAVVSDAITGIENEMASSDEFRIYPNPSPNGIFNIQNPTTANDELKAEVYSMDGRMVFEQIYFGNYVYVDISDLPRGHYVLRMYNENELFKSAKLIR